MPDAKLLATFPNPHPDRDYLIERRGGGLDTRYQIIPMDPIEELRDYEALKAHYGYGRPWPSRPQDGASKEEVQAYEDRFLFCPQTLQQWAEDFSSEDRVKHWLESPTGAAPAPAPTSAVFTPSDEAQVSVSGDTDFASLKKRLLANRD